MFTFELILLESCNLETCPYPLLFVTDYVRFSMLLFARIRKMLHPLGPKLSSTIAQNPCVLQCFFVLIYVGIVHQILIYNMFLAMLQLLA